MEKNQSSFPKAVCEKIFKAITFGRAFSKIRRISSRQQTPSPAIYAQNPSSPNSDPPTLTSPQPPKPKEGSEVPIKFDYTTRLPTPPTEKPKPTALNGSTQNNGRVPLASKAQNNSKPIAEKSNGQIQVQFEHQAKKEEGKDDSFSVFIDRTRNRIMSLDQDSGENSAKPVGHDHGHRHRHRHGHGHGGVGKDHHFSNYIDQTKRNIRTTWSMKERSPSFFK